MAEIITRLMTLEDVPAIDEVEAGSFAIPWSHDAFVKEVTENKCARYLVVCEDGVPVGYAGVWFVLDEGQITNIAIHPKKRGLGYGYLTFQKRRKLIFRQVKRRSFRRLKIVLFF